MLPTATIVFREVLEIALVLGIVMAATRGLPSRFRLALMGLAIGGFGAAIIAFFTDTISSAIHGVGQEVFNAGIMFLAVIFLSSTIVWMKRHGREMAANLKTVGHDVVTGERSAYVLVGVIAFATFREGAEIVLFTYGMLASGTFTLTSIITGGLLGLFGGTVIGLMLYFGLLKTARRHLFTVTSWMLIILTAGIAAQGANFLIAAGILPPLAQQMWDTSAIISGHSFIGQTLAVLIGYTPRPSGMELLFYTSVLCVVGLLYKAVSTQKQTVPVQTTPAPLASA